MDLFSEKQWTANPVHRIVLPSFDLLCRAQPVVSVMWQNEECDRTCGVGIAKTGSVGKRPACDAGTTNRKTQGRETGNDDDNGR